MIIPATALPATFPTIRPGLQNKIDELVIPSLEGIDLLMLQLEQIEALASDLEIIMENSKVQPNLKVSFVTQVLHSPNAAGMPIS